MNRIKQLELDVMNLEKRVAVLEKKVGATAHKPEPPKPHVEK